MGGNQKFAQFIYDMEYEEIMEISRQLARMHAETLPGVIKDEIYFCALLNSWAEVRRLKP